MYFFSTRSAFDKRDSFETVPSLNIFQNYLSRNVSSLICLNIFSRYWPSLAILKSCSYLESSRNLLENSLFNASVHFNFNDITSLVYYHYLRVNHNLKQAASKFNSNRTLFWQFQSISTTNVNNFYFEKTNLVLNR